MHRKLTSDEETELSKFNQSIYKCTSNGKELVQGSKFLKRRNYSVREILNENSHVNCNETGVIVHMLGAEIMTVQPLKKRNSTSDVYL